MSANQISTAVKAVLTRHWVDVSTLQIAAFRGTVRISGDIGLLPGRHPRVPNKTKLENIFCEVRRVQGVRRVQCDA